MLLWINTESAESLLLTSLTGCETRRERIFGTNSTRLKFHLGKCGALLADEQLGQGPALGSRLQSHGCFATQLNMSRTLSSLKAWSKLLSFHIISILWSRWKLVRAFSGKLTTSHNVVLHCPTLGTKYEGSG